MRKGNKNGESRMSNVVAWIVAIAMIVVALAMNIKAASWRTPLRLEQADSIKFNYWRNTTLIGTGQRNNTTTYDTTLYADNDYWYTAEFQIWYQGEDSATNYVTTRGNPRTTTAWKIPAKWNEPTDSVWAINYVNGVPTDSAKLTGVQSVSEIISVSNDYFYTKSYRMYFSGDTTPYSYNWQMDMTIAASGVVTIPGDSLGMCQVSGHLFQSNGRPIAGADIIATRIAGDAVTGVFTGTRIIITGEPVGVQTDTSGYFNLALIRSGSVSPVANAFYNIVGQVGERKLFEIKKLSIPATGNVNLADSLANRL